MGTRNEVLKMPRFSLKEASIRETAREKSNRSGMQTKINFAVLAAASLNAWFLKTAR